MPLVNTLEEPFAPTSKIGLVWRVASALRVVPSPFVSSSSFLNVYNAWLHVLNSTLMLPLLSNKVSEDNVILHGLFLHNRGMAQGIFSWRGNYFVPTKSDFNQFSNKNKGSFASPFLINLNFFFHQLNKQ